jgi:hypothetical protein
VVFALAPVVVVIAIFSVSAWMFLSERGRRMFDRYIRLHLQHVVPFLDPVSYFDTNDDCYDEVTAYVHSVFSENNMCNLQMVGHSSIGWIITGF